MKKEEKTVFTILLFINFFFRFIIPSGNVTFLI